MLSLRFFLLGTPRIERDGEVLFINRRKAVALLAYLAVTGQPQSRDALATLFWPEHDQSGARANLRRDLSRLKQALDDEVLLIDRVQAGVNPEAALWLDVAAFKAHLLTVQQHKHPLQELCPDCYTALAEAVSLYGDEFMAGFTLPDSPEFDEWQFFQAESLRHALAGALQQLIHWHVGQGEYERAIEHGRRWLALDPLREPAQRQLMQLYAWSGQQAAALRQYQECVRLLDEELGVEPEEETVALYEAIKARQLTPPALLVAQPALVPGATPKLSPHERYIQEELLMVSGQGEVYHGLDRVANQPVVIKRLRPDLVARRPELVARLVREGEALSQLDHPNIVRMLAILERDDDYAIVMEYVAGGSLRQLLDGVSQLPQERALDIALELADALSRAHHLGIIHRDLKPDNVLLAADGTPRLTDFGMARLGGDDDRLTQTGSFIGSPAYMSPEALHGEELDARSDIWSFGVLLYEMLAGRRPFKGEQITAVILSILNDEVPEITRFQPNLPSPLADLLRRMLNKERAQRPASARSVAAELEAIRAGKGNVAAREPERRISKMVSSPRPRSSAPVHRRTPGSTPLSARPFAPTDQQIRFTNSADGTRLAYAVVGQGPPLVKVANPLTHLQYDWESPVWRHWVEELSRDHMLVRYDERGCGLSERQVTNISIEAWVSDLEAVVNDLGLERFPIIGTSQGASVGIAYAVRYPEKVSHLICHGGYVRGRFHRNLTPEQLAETETLLNLIRLGWGKESPAFRQVFATLFVPEGTPEQQEWFTELARITADPEIAAIMERAFFEINVTDLAPQVKAPTLVTHPRGDQIVPLAEGRLLAELIPNARFVPLAGNNHLLLEDEPAWLHFLQEVRGFLETESPRRWPTSRTRWRTRTHGS